MNNNREMDKQPIYMDSESYQQLLNNLRALQTKLSQIKMYHAEKPILMGQDMNIDSDYLSNSNDLGVIQDQIYHLTDQIRRVVILEKHNNPELIDINDVVQLIVTDSNGNTSEKILRLVAGNIDIFAEIRQASINSPIGQAIYGQPVGTITSYVVKDRRESRKFDVQIVGKLNQKLTR